MTHKKKAEPTTDVWEIVGDDNRVLVTSDDFHVHVWKSGAAWKARVWDKFRNRIRRSKLVYTSDSAAKAASQAVIDEMRSQRQEKGATQRKLL